MLLAALAAAAGRRQGRSAANSLAALAVSGGRATAEAASGGALLAIGDDDEIDGRRFSSYFSSSDLFPRLRFADPRLQPPSIVRLPPALQQAHEAVSSSKVAGGPRRLGPLAAALAGKLASRSRSLGRGGASAAAWEGDEEGEEESGGSEEDGEELDNVDDDDGRILTLDLVTGGAARLSASDGSPLGRADEEALGWKSKRRGKKRRGGENSSSLSLGRVRPAPPAYSDDATAAAYALARAPASFAATLHALLALRASGSMFRGRDGGGGSSSSLSPPPPPLRVLDFGAGTGAALLAAAAAFDGRNVEVVAVERSEAMARAGRAVVESLRAAGEEAEEAEEEDGDGDSESDEEEDEQKGELPLPAFSLPRRVRWVRSLEEAAAFMNDSSADDNDGGEIDHYWRSKREAAAAAAKKGGESSSPCSKQHYDLVLASFSLGESPDADAEGAAVESLWELVAPGGALVVVEPGTPAGSLSVRAARDRVLSMSGSGSTSSGGGGGGEEREAASWAKIGQVSKPAHVAAPCLHDGSCPLASSPGTRTWCHFGQRLERPRAQRVAAASAAAASGRVRGGRKSAAAASASAVAERVPDASSSSPADLSRPAFSVSVSSHADVRFSYVALVAAPRPKKGQGRGGGGRGGGAAADEEEDFSSSPPSVEPDEQLVLARVTRAPRPRSGHVLVGACFDPESIFSPLSEEKSPPPSSLDFDLEKEEENKSSSSSSFGASVVTVTSSSKPKGTYRAARGAKWGGVIALPASAVAKAAALAAKNNKKKMESNNTS